MSVQRNEQNLHDTENKYRKIAYGNKKTGKNILPTSCLMRSWSIMQLKIMLSDKMQDYSVYRKVLYFKNSN